MQNEYFENLALGMDEWTEAQKDDLVMLVRVYTTWKKGAMRITMASRSTTFTSHYLKALETMNWERKISKAPPSRMERLTQE